jgi:hypothetical protein
MTTDINNPQKTDLLKYGISEQRAVVLTEPSRHCTPELDTGAPGGIYLCQVDECVSCGACCGLYNVADTSRDHMTAMLAERTDQFAAVPRTTDAIDAFADRIQTTQYSQRPFEHFHHCPFTGLIGPQRSRVGCLLHPMADGNQGVDFRGLSYYGGLACRTYFCPATHHLPVRYKQILRSILREWYLYGLIVTERTLVAALFERIEILLDQPLDLSMLRRNPTAVQRLTELLQLKTQWPYRPRAHDTLCHFFFSYPPYARPAIDYRQLGTEISPYDTILVELVSEFASLEDLRCAETLVETRIQAAAAAVSMPPF